MSPNEKRQRIARIKNVRKTIRDRHGYSDNPDLVKTLAEVDRELVTILDELEAA